MEECESLVDSVCIFCSLDTSAVGGAFSSKNCNDGNVIIEKEEVEVGEQAKKKEEDPPPNKAMVPFRNDELISRFLNKVLHLEGMEGEEEDELKLKAEDLEVLKGLPVCGICLGVIGVTVDKKLKAEELEENVKRLQEEVMEEMKKLEGQLKEYYVEMKRIEEILKRSDVERLKGALKKKKRGRSENVGGDIEEVKVKVLEEAAQEEGKEEEEGQEGSGDGGDSLEGIMEEEKSEDDSNQVVVEGIIDQVQFLVGGNVQAEVEVEAVANGGNEVDLEENEENDQNFNYFSIVNILRDSILYVVQELDDKHGDNLSGGDNRRKSKRLRKKTRKRYIDPDPGLLEDSKLDPLLHCAIKMEGHVGGGGDEDDRNGGGSRPKRRKRTLNLVAVDSLQIPDFNMETIIKTEPVDEEPAAEQEPPVPSTAPPLEGPLIEDDGFEPEVIEEVVVTVGGQGHRAPRGRPKRKRTPDQKGEESVEDEVDEGEATLEDDESDMDTSDDDFFLDEDEDKLGSESESSSTSSSDGDQDSSEDYDEGEEYGRKRGGAKRKKLKDKKQTESKTNPNSKKKAAYSRVLDSINFSGMSKLKRKLVQRILHKKYRRPTRKPKTPGKEFVEDPRLQHFIEYDPQSGTFSLDGILINIQEEKNQDNEDILILQCSLCNWVAKPAQYSRHSVDSFIYNHIAGQHLNLFQCVQCGSNLGGYKQYSDHILGHRMGFACDVCGRPLGGAQALARHKWSHLNEEEAQELIDKGLKDPREKKESGKIYPCPTCGKIFPQRCQLKKHEKVHAQVRERITCEICGKLFLPSGFISHKRYYCFPEGVEHPRISCPLCPKVFRNKQFMQVHMDRAHNNERNHKCQKCGKGFKTKKDLMTHEETHTDERAFFCKKGCGRSYKTRKNCNAHEKRCDGRGGILVQRFLDAGEDRPFGCRKGCGRKYKTRRTLRGHEKVCKGELVLGEGNGGGGALDVGGGGGIVTVLERQNQEQGVTPMSVLGAALQASMEAVIGGGGGIMQNVVQQVPEAVVTETVVTRVGQGADMLVTIKNN